MGAVCTLTAVSVLSLGLLRGGSSRGLFAGLVISGSAVDVACASSGLGVAHLGNLSLKAHGGHVVVGDPFLLGSRLGSRVVLGLLGRCLLLSLLLLLLLLLLNLDRLLVLLDDSLWRGPQVGVVD